MNAPYSPSCPNEQDLVCKALLDELITHGSGRISCTDSTDLLLHLAPYATDGKHWNAIQHGDKELCYRLGLSRLEPQYAKSFCGTIQEVRRKLGRVLQSIAMTSAPVHVINET